MSGAMWAFLRRDYRLARTARLALAWQIVSVACTVPTMYYLGRLLRPPAPVLCASGGDYFAFVSVGVACLGLCSAGMGACAAAVRQEQMGGTLDVLLLSPAPVWALAAGASLWTMLVAAGQTGLYLVFAAIAFHLDFSRANVAGAAAALVLTMGVCAALGVLSASLVLLLRRPDVLTSLVTSASVLLAGVFYPTRVLPSALQRAAELLPLTHALRALRLALLRGDGVAALGTELRALLLFVLVLSPVALVAGRVALAEARRSGIPAG